MKKFPLTSCALIVAGVILISACSGEGGSPAALADDAPSTAISDIQLRVSLPSRMQNFEDVLEVIVTAGGDSQVRLCGVSRRIHDNFIITEQPQLSPVFQGSKSIRHTNSCIRPI
jgi:hypothetical protein